jgi:hypothetical protein
MKWPDDADGDVFRRLESHAFDFSAPIDIDFNVDFSSWPPSPDAIQLLARYYPNLKIFDPSEGSDGYLAFVLHEHVSYELVTRIQNEVSELMLPYGGCCESWGILHG